MWACLLRLLRWIPAFAGMTWRGFVFLRKLAHDLDNAGADAEGAWGGGQPGNPALFPRA